MTTLPTPPPQTPVVDLVIRLGLAALLAWLAMRVFAPFAALMIWAVVLAIALYPITRWIATRLGISGGWSATLLVLAILALLGTPTVMLGMSFIDDMLRAYGAVMDGTFHLPPPGDNVAEWPLVGPQIHATWQSASANLAEFIGEHQQQLRDTARRAASALLGGVGTLLSLLASFIIAGVMIAYAQPGASTSQRIFRRICGEQVGDDLHTLSVATVRSVAMGVVGVSFIQALLLGVGFLLAGIPIPGILAVAALLLGIVQVPAALFTIPAIIWVWAAGDGSTMVNTLLTIYLVIAGLADNVLKPMFLARGVAVPMPIVLLGALGGMLSSGLIGLFAGAVILAMAYQVFMAWVNETRPADPPAEPNG